MALHTVLIVDDEPKLRALLARIIGLEGFEVAEAADCKAAMKKLSQVAIDIVLCDVKLPDGNGVDLTENIKQLYPAAEVILLTAHGNIADGVQAIKNGAFDYLTKGDDNNRIIPLLYKAAEKVALNKRVQQLENQLGNRYAFSSITGSSKALQAAVAAAQKVAPTDTTVLLTGETGTGKEVFAQAIHGASRRNRKSFIAVNCSAFSKELLENELFGHKAGAFTGAVKDSKGILEEANGGTVFLDEIGEMPPDLQAKLLRVLESGEFLKVGDSKPMRADVRFIAATNRNLQHEVDRGHFREDLFYRISVFAINLPPLRQRQADIEPLANGFAAWFAAKTNKKNLHLSQAYLQALQQHPWKGNIRELKNIIERSVILTDGPTLLPETLPAEFRQPEPHAEASAFDLASAEKMHIQKVLAHTGGNKTKAAELLNIALTTLYRKMETYHLE
ncbi:MAG: sigma-54 dependent transcriptional regulator [Chitinophagaceae bacterium]|nr:sigma-54 dependent transcriptional regulator [Chitinophagaceae bacterium]